MSLTAALRIRLLDAIEANTLVFLCGAGLSMPSATVYSENEIHPLPGSVMQMSEAS